MSRLRRPFQSDRFFFVICRLRRERLELHEDEFAFPLPAIQAARETHQFLLTASVFLPDHWYALLFPRYPVTLSVVLQSLEVRPTHSINLDWRESAQLGQGIMPSGPSRSTTPGWHTFTSNPVKRGLVKAPSPEMLKRARVQGARASVLPIDSVRLPADMAARLY